MKNWILILLGLVSSITFGQAVGEYRSKSSGDWKTLSVWERWNGSTWVTPSITQGYPGELNVYYGPLLLQSGNTISIDVSSSNFSTLPIESITITGKLLLVGANNQNNVVRLDTKLVNVTPTIGTIEFKNKVSLQIASTVLPGSAVLKVSQGGIIGDCSNNQDIQLGTNFVSFCKGGGSGNVSFDDLMNLGGSPDVVINPIGQICAGETLNLEGKINGPVGSNGVFNWYLNNQSTPFATGSKAQIKSIKEGIYTIKLTYSATYQQGVFSNSEGIQFTVGVKAGKPSIGNIASLTCATKGSVVLNSLPNNSWTVLQSGAAQATYTGSGTTFIVPNLDAGIYTFTVTSGGCSSPPSENVTISDKSTTTWNGSTWSNGVPDSTKNAIIERAFSVTQDFVACGLTINSGITIRVPEGRNLIITNAVTSNGQLIFENNASLVQTSNAKNIGKIEYRRTSSAMKNFDYTYWSSPVTGQTAKLLSPNTLSDKYHTYDPSKGWVFNDGMMNPGVGFIIRTPKPGVYGAPYPETVVMPYKQPVAFKGIPNNGDYEFKVGANQFNLIGNPYPSAIDANKFMQANKDIIYGALYFWTHNTAITNNDYTANDYATYTLAGGTGTAPSKNPGLNTSTPNGFIAAGQSFFVGNTVTGSFQFTNAMRVAGNNAQFFKQTAVTKSSNAPEHRIWLNLTNSEGAFKQLLIGYLAGATNDFDNLYDGPSFDGQPFVDFYSINKDKNLTIQGRALPFDETDEVPLGYRSTVAGPFEIAIENTEGQLAQQEVWLEDKKLGLLHDLSKEKYKFTAISGIENDRFVLKYYNNQLGVEDNVITDKQLIVSVKNKVISINSSDEAITKVQIFDLMGRKLYDKAKINLQKWSIATLRSSNQVLIVRTTLANGAIKSNKIIF
ncbi:T9SS sorting signal type C domain-containing protein [Flavobacterium sp. TSSA_36]|uniref:T9SS sorting signal type C domain-containing protein n=1 Tax=Flavobacterium sp. TSSA_36 TaxID=3447669 RepID=UPI003F39A73C